MVNSVIDVANRAAEAAGAILCAYYADPPAMEDKDALSPVVTRADRESEDAMRSVIRGAFPEDSILGEEGGLETGSSGRCWVLDPLDGTIAFVCGRPTFVSLIGLWEGDQPLLGVIDQPVIGHRWAGGPGANCQLGSMDCRTSGVRKLADARFGATDPKFVEHPDTPGLYERLTAACRLTSLGGDGYSYGLLASGRLDLVVESGLAWHDIAALVPVIESAGGVITGLDGQPVRPGASEYSAVAAATPELHAAALELASSR